MPVIVDMVSLVGFFVLYIFFLYLVLFENAEFVVNYGVEV